MKKFVNLFLLFSVFFASFSAPTIAYCFEETVYVFQTVDDPAGPIAVLWTIFF